jgi:hypothetical protein
LIILFAIDVFFAEKAAFNGYKSIFLCLFSLKSTFIDHSFRYWCFLRWKSCLKWLQIDFSLLILTLALLCGSFFSILMLSLYKKLHLLATNRFFSANSHFSALIWIILFDIDAFFIEDAAFTGYKSIFCWFNLQINFFLDLNLTKFCSILFASFRIFKCGFVLWTLIFGIS